jgi:hypothetical protein
MTDTSDPSFDHDISPLERHLLAFSAVIPTIPLFAPIAAATLAAAREAMGVNFLTRG